MARLDLGGRSLEYEFVGESAGDERTMVFLHEGLGSISLWKDFPRRMAAATGCRSLVYSRYGCGHSAPLTGSRDPDYMHVEALSVLPQLLERLDVRKPVLFGHSDGASIALIYAAGGGPVDSLILMAPHVMVEDVSIRSITAVKHTFETTDLREKLRRHHADPEATFYGWCDIWLDPRFRQWNIEDSLAKIKSPILAIQGLEDEYGTMEQIERIANAVAQTALLKLRDCRHSPHRDQPELVIAAAVRHLQVHSAL